MLASGTLDTIIQPPAASWAGKQRAYDVSEDLILIKFAAECAGEHYADRGHSGAPHCGHDGGVDSNTTLTASSSIAPRSGLVR